MTGAELYEKAKNNGRGFLAFDRLPGVQKGLWNNAALEIGNVAQRLSDARTFEAGLVLGYLSKHKRLDLSDPFTAGAVDSIRRGIHRGERT